MLVATAGHIDHGKTSLVRALTGVETDRLPEERARGITIDLGFAYWRLDDGLIGFVDVPGHERFVRNMLAGVGGIDLALIVVAADDGVMPQTIEHVQILDLLGISRAIVAITKCDRASRSEVDTARTQVSTLLSGTGIASAPIFEVSATTGAGIAELGAALRAASVQGTKREDMQHGFRLAIDRAFSVTGAGTIVTGTVLDGALEPGAKLRLTPRGLEVRVRGLQSASAPMKRVAAGERCAVNLTGIELSQVRRGDWLLASNNAATTTRMEVRLRVLSTRDAALKHQTPVHLHIGTADIEARVLVPRQASIPAGNEAVVHLVLESPTSAATGDHFVLRDQSARASIGGGRVIDPFVTSDRRSQTARAPVTAALEAPGPDAALAALLAIPGHEIDTRHFERCFNLELKAAQALYRDAGVTLLGGLAIPSARTAALSTNVVDILTAFHRATPDSEGMGARELKTELGERLSAEAFAALLQHLHEKQVIVSTGSFAKLPSHVATLTPADQALWEKLLRWLEERGAAPFTPTELAEEARTRDSVIAALLHRKRTQGEVWRIVGERFLLRQQVAALAARARDLTEQVDGAGFSAAQYRDAIGTGRTWAIHILEFFDAIGVTRRDGDLRKVRPDYALIVGSAAPYQPERGGQARKPRDTK